MARIGLRCDGTLIFMFSGELITRRQYLMTKLLFIDGVPAAHVREAVSTTLLAHPEWDLNEVRTWQEWEQAS